MRLSLICLDFNISLGDILLVLGLYLTILILAIYLLFTFIRNFRKKGTASEYLTNRIFPKILILLLIILVFYAFLST